MQKTIFTMCRLVRDFATGRRSLAWLSDCQAAMGGVAHQTIMSQRQ